MLSVKSVPVTMKLQGTEADKCVLTLLHDKELILDDFPVFYETISCVLNIA
jgi:hypothetical protein